MNRGKKAEKEDDEPFLDEEEELGEQEIPTAPLTKYALPVIIYHFTPFPTYVLYISPSREMSELTSCCLVAPL